MFLFSPHFGSISLKQAGEILTCLLFCSPVGLGLLFFLTIQCLGCRKW